MGKSPWYVLLGLLLSVLLTRHIQARGAVLGALSSTNTTFSAPIELEESLRLNGGTAGPYVKRSRELVSYAEGLTNIPVPESLGVPEAAALFDIWTKDKAISRGKRRLFPFWFYLDLLRHRWRRRVVHGEVQRGWREPS